MNCYAAFSPLFPGNPLLFSLQNTYTNYGIGVPSIVGQWNQGNTLSLFNNVINYNPSGIFGGVFDL
jgi:hypothetical protein